MSNNARRIHIDPSEAKPVYEGLYADGGDARALSVYLRKVTRDGQRPAWTPTLSRSLYRRVNELLKAGRSKDHGK